MSGNICAVSSCKNYYYKNPTPENKLSFFSFPKDKQRRDEWVHKCCRKDKFNVSTARICSDHFKPDDFEGLYVQMGIPHKKQLKQTGETSLL